MKRFLNPLVTLVSITVVSTATAARAGDRVAVNVSPAEQPPELPVAETSASTLPIITQSSPNNESSFGYDREFLNNRTLTPNSNQPFTGTGSDRLTIFRFELDN